MHSGIADQVRDPACSDCMMSSGAQKVCIVGSGNSKAKIMIVSKMPDSARFREEMRSALAEVDIAIDDCFTSSAIKCRNWDRDPSNKDIKTCRKFLDAEIDIVRPEWILALGNEALLATAGKSGITKYRGQVFEHSSGAKVIPTISPSAVKRNPGMEGGFLADLRFFSAQVDGREIGIKGPKITVADDIAGIKTLIRMLNRAYEVAYDVETVGDGEWALDARIVTLSMTIYTKLEHGSTDLRTFVIPLYHPESPFRRVWEQIVQRILPHLKKVKKRIAHNGKYDDKWLRKFGKDPFFSQTFDTLIAAHMLDENRPKGLKPLAQSLLGVPPWAMSTKNLLAEPLKKIIRYNAHDTHYTWHLKQIFSKELRARSRTLRLFTAIMMPASSVYTASEMLGIWVDREVLSTNGKIAHDMRDDVENRLSEWVPKIGDEGVPSSDSLVDLGWPTLGKKQKLSPMNFNPTKFSRWWLYDYLGVPVLERGKEKPNGDQGDPSMREGVLLELKEEHPAVPVMLERVSWNKMCTSFFEPYEQIVDDNDRIHTVFKLHGTVTGRTSSGKEDEEKITASKGKRRGVNLQQVPRNKLVRGVFGAEPPNWFVEFDFSQIELRIAAFIAREHHMLSLYQQGADIHRITAASVLGIPESQVTTEQRKKAGKGNNFGFLYGMSWKKFITTAAENYDLIVDEWTARAFRERFFELYPDLPEWHRRQRRLVRRHGYVESPLGRVRHLPDIYSPDQQVQGEAERQAINSPVQGMGSDMCLLSMNLVARKLQKRKMDTKILGTVHDAINFEVPPDEMAEVLPLIKETMENLPLERLFGVELDVPILADCKVGHHWGGATEISGEDVYAWAPSLVA